MKRIFKKVLKIQDEQQIELSEGARILSVGEQRGEIFIWYVSHPVATPNIKVQYRRISIRGTGSPLGDIEGGNHLGTVQMPDGLVWHVFGDVLGMVI